MKKKYFVLAALPFLAISCGNSAPSVTPPAATLSSITLNTENVQKTFDYNATFTYEGLKVTAVYSDQSRKEVTNYNVTSPNMTQVGEQDVTVSYTEGDIKKTDSYKITVNAEPQGDPVLSSIILNTENVKKDFDFGETFTYEGLVVTAKYTKGEDKVVTDYTVSSPNMFVSGSQEIIVTYSEENVTVSNKYSITVAPEEEGTPITDAQKEELKKSLRDTYNTLDIDDYSSSTWKRIVETFTNAIQAVDNSQYYESASKLVNDAIAIMESAVKKGDALKGTLFDYVSSSSNYEFDRDEDNNLVVSYPDYPGHWVHIGTTKLFKEPATNNNVFELKFRNDIDEQIEVCMQITNDSGFKADTQIVKVEGNETKTLTLEYEEDCTKLYFFIDSCSEHHRSGRITILETKFSYVDRPVDDKLYEPKDIAINVDISKTDDGLATAYTLTNEDHPESIERISVILEQKYNGNDDGHQYFGYVLYAGSQHSDQLKESQGYGQEYSDKSGSRYIFNYPITGKLYAGSKIYSKMAYAADGLTFKVVSYRLHYGVTAEVVSEKVDVNQPIYQNDSGYIDGDKEKGHLTALVSTNSLVNRGRVRKMDVEFSTLNTHSYGKSQIYFTNFEFTGFDSGNNNVLNIGPIMDTSKSGEAVKGTMTVYPYGNMDLSSDINISMVCWWASATNVTVDSVTFYTDLAATPEAVTSLEAHPLDSGIVLTWSGGKHATVFDVYMNDTFVSSVTTNYITINELTNGTEYTFKVVARNVTGSSDPVTVKGTPTEGATYDMFIEGLNTSLEQDIGQSGIEKMFTQSNFFLNESNNERLKSVITKMQNGQKTKVAYMGGSITVGENATVKDEKNHKEGYAYYSYQWLKRTYDVNNQSEYINGSISGTGSEIGIVRAQEDILKHNPDLIFIEFAANNGTTEFYKQSYESLVRKCMALDSHPAIVLLFSCTSYTLNGAWKYMAEVGSHYSLPMFSFDKAMREVCTPYNNKQTKGQDLIWDAFSDDGTHPNDNGHKLYAKCLCYFMRNLINRDTDEPATIPSSPSTAGMDKYDNLVFCNNTNSDSLVTSLGSFVKANTATPSTSEQSDVTAFQNGWKKTDTETNNEMVIEVNAKNFIIIYEAGNPKVSGDPKGNIVVTYTNKNDATDTGTLSWDVSKTCKQNNDSDITEITANDDGWQNPVAILVFDKANASDYIITIKMETTSGICTIMAFGYSA